MLGNTSLPAVALLLVTQVAVLLVALRIREVVSSDGVATRDESVDGDAVECPECGATNDRGYRFCAECVAELPGAAPFEEASTTPFSRNVR